MPVNILNRAHFNSPSYTGPSPAYWSRWSAGPPTSASFFPIGAFQQNIETTFALIAGYADLGDAMQQHGYTMAVGTWDWLSTSFAQTAVDRGLYLIGPLPTSLAAYTTAQKARIVGWDLEDEPDGRSSSDASLNPTPIKALYDSAKVTDPTRPMFINFTKPMGGGAWAGPSGGLETGTVEGDLVRYQTACDITCLDWYFWVDSWTPPEDRGAWGYGWACDNQRQKARQVDPAKPVWMFVETDEPFTEAASGKITPAQFEAACWNALIHGARGLVHFQHDFKTIASGSADDEAQYAIFDSTQEDLSAMRAKVAAVNARITGLAPVLNSPELGAVSSTTGRESAAAYVTVGSSAGSNVPIDVMVRRYGGQTYLFAQASGVSGFPLSAATTGTFTWVGSGPPSAPITVRDESRTVTPSGGVWTDTFTAYQVHIYVW